MVENILSVPSNARKMRTKTYTSRLTGLNFSNTFSASASILGRLSMVGVGGFFDCAVYLLVDFKTAVMD